MIRLTHICKSFNSEHRFAIQDVSLEVQEGKTLVLLGPSGSGKTTLLKMINGLVKPTSGSIEIDHQDIATVDPVMLRRSIGYVFQGTHLFPHMTVAENVGIVLRLNKVPKKQRQERIEELLVLVNLPAKIYADRYPDELSGGQRQRVGVARALASNPKYLLMDEPFGALDPITRNDLQEELIDLRARLQKTIVFVTHDIFEALRLGDEIAIINQGRLEQIGSGKQIFQKPATDFVKTLLQKPWQQLAQLTELDP